MNYETDFCIELSEYRLDMTNIFHYLTAQYKDDIDRCPMVVVVRDLPDRKAAIRLNDRKGITRAILLREAAGPVMLSNLYEVITAQSAKDTEDFPQDCAFFYSSNDIYNLYVCTLSIADALKIPCPQLIYTVNMPLENAGSLTAEDEYGKVNTLFLRQFTDFSRTAAALAYEMRKIWQHEKHEKLYYESYFELSPEAGEKGLHEFRMQKAEIDAEAFSLRFLGHMLKASVVAGKDDAEVNDAINARALKMAVPF